MKSAGFVRKMDNLGRILLPMELRRTFDIGIKNSVEIHVEGDQIILKKYEPACIYRQAREVVNFKGKNICSSCLGALQKE